MDASILRIDIEAVEGGTAWSCQPAKNGEMSCATHEVPSFEASGAHAEDLVDGAAVGHDRLYLLRRLTSSPPEFP